MPVITLTTEWKPDDIYNGIIKGKLSSLVPGIAVIDNACSISVFNIPRAAFIVRNTFENYPEGSVHLLLVHSEAGKEQNILAVKARGHYFIGTDNGIFNLILNGEPEAAFKIDPQGSHNELDIFARVAASLINGSDAGQLGTPVKSINERMPFRATIDKDVIIGSVIFTDSYGNAISNITREVFLRVFENRKYRILIQSNKNYTEKISENYSDVPVGELLARFNQLDLMELAINGANICELLSIETGSVLRIEGAVKSTSPDKLF